MASASSRPSADEELTGIAGYFSRRCVGSRLPAVRVEYPPGHRHRRRAGPAKAALEFFTMLITE